MPRRRPIDQQALDSLLARDDRVATHAELIELGMPASTITYRSRPDGSWTRLLPGVIAAHSGSPTSRQRLIAAVKYAGEGAVVSGSAALRFHGFRSVKHQRTVLVLVPHARQRSSHDYVLVERTRRMPSSVERDGIAYATVARAVIDACRRIKRLDTVREIVAESVQSNKCSAKELLEELRHAQRRGSALPRRVLREIAAGIRSVAEAKAREWLRRAGVPEPDWNADLLDANGNWIASPDGYWEDVGVALEIDSMEWHLRPRRYKRTQRRQRRMAMAASYNITLTSSPA